MDIKKQEKGNVVVLTLLGLSVAILAGIVALYFIGRTAPEKVIIQQTDPEEFVFEESPTASNAREGWRLYEEALYNVSFEYPQGWVVATGTLSTGDPVISISKATEASNADQVYSTLDTVPHVSIYPRGVASEGLWSKMEESGIVFEIEGMSALDYILGSGRPWATMVSFETYPESWNEFGFAFARLPIVEENIVYMRGDTTIEQYEFDPFAGDVVERNGIIDTGLRAVQEEILRSIRFRNSFSIDANKEKPLVILEFPSEGDIARNPLLVKGQIMSERYRDNEFVVRLETAEGQLVAQVGVLPSEIGDEMIPFEVSMTFAPPSATSGVLYIGRSIFSDSFKDDAEVAVPVLFDVQGG